MTLVFVYGTLKQGYSNNYLLNSSTFIGSAVTQQSFLMQTCGFPIAMPAPKGQGNPIKGEVYEVDDETLEELDGLEAEGRMYDRRREIVELENDQTHLVVYMYVGAPAFWRQREHTLKPIKATDGVLNWRR